MNTILSRLTTEQVNTNTLHIDECSTREILELINNEDRLVPDAVRHELPNITKAVEGIVKRLRKGGRLFYVGAGTSGRIGILDASECPPTFSTDPHLVQGIIAGGKEAVFRAVEGAEDDEGAGRALIDEYKMTGDDVVVGITASGCTPFVIGAIDEARRCGLLTIAVSNNSANQLREKAEIEITPVVGPEVIQGSTRMKSGTAQKLVLNMLTTCSMIQLGKVYGNLMVDLQASNYKLIERGKRIIMAAAGVDSDKAAKLLESSGGSPKVAIMMSKANCSREKAEKLLEDNEHLIYRALSKTI